MGAKDIEADYVEITQLTDKQRAYVDHYMTNGFNKRAAYHAAGYTCSDPDKLDQRISRLHNGRLVQEALMNRQKMNTASLRKYSPLDVMCENLDYWFTRAKDETLELGDRNRARAEAQTAAVAAAPYVHPKLQAIAIKTIAEKDLNDYTDDELDVTIARIEQALQAGDPSAIGQGSAGKKTH